MVVQLRPQAARFLSTMLYFVIFGFCSLCSYVGRAKDVVSKVMLQPVCHAGFFWVAIKWQNSVIHSMLPSP